MAQPGMLIITHLCAAGIGFAVAPRELLESEVKNEGFFQAGTKRVLAAAVERLRTESSLVIYAYRGFAAGGWLCRAGRPARTAGARFSHLHDPTIGDVRGGHRR